MLFYFKHSILFLLFFYFWNLSTLYPEVFSSSNKGKVEKRADISVPFYELGKEKQLLFSSKEEKRRLQKSLEEYELVSQLFWKLRFEPFLLDVATFQKLKKTYPNSPYTHYFQSLLYFYDANAAEALISIDKALEIRSNLDMAWNAKALIYLFWEKKHKALAFFQKAYNIDPHNYNYSYNLAFVLSQLGQYKEALSYLTQSLKIKVNHSYSYYLRALIHSKNGNTEIAIASFQEAEKYGQPTTIFYLDFLDTLKNTIENKELVRVGKILQYRELKNSSDIRKLIQVWKKLARYSSALALLDLLKKRKELKKQDKRDYVYFLVENGKKADPYILRIASQTEEIEALREYAEECETNKERFKHIQARRFSFPSPR